MTESGQGSCFPPRPGIAEAIEDRPVAVGEQTLSLEMEAAVGAPQAAGLGHPAHWFGEGTAH